MPSGTIAGVDVVTDLTRYRVEVDVRAGLPSLAVIGLPDRAVRDIRDTVRAAIINAGFDFPLGRISANIAPARVRRDVNPAHAIAVAILAATGQRAAPVTITERDLDIGGNALVGYPACLCSDEYGPCEQHGETLCVREGASARTGDESTMCLIEDLLDCGAELSATGRIEYARLARGLDLARDSISGCAWFGEDDSESARDLAHQLESYVADLWVIHDDGYRIVRPSADCPLLDT